MEITFKIGLFFLITGVIIILQFAIIKILAIFKQIEVVKYENSNNLKDGKVREYICSSFIEFISDKKCVAGLVLGGAVSFIISVLFYFFPPFN